MSAEPATTSGRDAPGVIAPPPLVYLGGLLVGFALQRLLPAPRQPRTVTRPMGGALLVTGVALAAWFITAFRRAGTPVDPRQTPTALVTTGPYRITRNPGYLALALVYSGITLVAGAFWPLLLLVPTLIVIDRGVIAREERYLEVKFGDEYIELKGRTRRWI
ncbi:MAG: isoprenylcysteine carboxylmethyltransferase family protein [Chloroflexi bacterium]|nr:isoprenylcysteine carboxylmethyltransferase family protein [Chloroflexota bacterium]